MLGFLGGNWGLFGNFDGRLELLLSIFGGCPELPKCLPLGLGGKSLPVSLVLFSKAFILSDRLAEATGGLC